MSAKSECKSQTHLPQLTMLSVKPIRLKSETLLQGQHEIEIEHQGMLYRLRCTAQGKLILTK